MNLDSIKSYPIETGDKNLVNRVSSLRSIDAPNALKLDGGFSVSPGRYVTLAQLNPVGYVGDTGLARENPVFSVRFNLDKNGLTSTILARTRARVIEVFRMDDSEVHIRRAKSFLQSPYGQEVEAFATAAREFLKIPPAPITTAHSSIARLICIEEALNLMYSRVILLYFIQNEIPQVRFTPDGQCTIGKGWPKVGTGEIFQATAVLRRNVSRLNLKILNEAFDGRIRDESWIRAQLRAK